MICQFCGSTLDDDELECPYCGHKTELNTSSAPAEPEYVETTSYTPEEEVPPAYDEGVYSDYSRDVYEAQQRQQQYGDYDQRAYAQEQQYGDYDQRAYAQEQQYGDYDQRAYAQEQQYSEYDSPAYEGQGAEEYTGEYDVDSYEAEQSRIYAEEEQTRSKSPMSAVFGALSSLLPKKSEEPRKSASGRSSASSSQMKSLGPIVPVIAAGLSLIFSIVLLVKVSQLTSKLDSLEQTMLSQLYQIQSANNELSNSINVLTGNVSAVSTTISEAADSKNITITRNPSSDSTYLGRGSDSDVTQNSPIFYAEATGMILKVEWQVKENGEWVTLTWDGNSNNATYGFHIYNEITSTQAHSELCSRGVTALAFNKQYRCVFSDATGTKATEVVTLSERAA